MLVLGLLLLLGLREGLRLTLLRELDHRLRDDALEVRLLIEQTQQRLPQGPQQGLERKAESHKSEGWFVEVYRGGGEPLWAYGEVPGGLLTILDPALREVTAGYRLNVTRANWHHEELLVRVGISLAEVQADLERLDHLLLVAGAVLLGVAPVGAYWLAGRATRPLAKMIQTAADLRPTHLEERLPIQGTGDELDRLAFRINGFLDHLADYLAQKRDFLANVAHELRSPLTALRSAVEVAVRQERTAAEYRDLLGDLLEHCGQLTTLVNQLLLLAESDAGKLRPGEQTVSLSQLVRQVVAMFEGVASAREVHLSSDIASDLVLRGEAHHLRQVVGNFLDNALKFTPAGGQVTVSLRRAAQGNTAVLEVADTGCGIPEEQLSRVSRRFFRGDPARRRDGDGPQGTGLGLSICQAILDAYGGQLALRSTLGVGTVVTATLPLSPEGADGATPA